MLISVAHPDAASEINVLKFNAAASELFQELNELFTSIKVGAKRCELRADVAIDADEFYLSSGSRAF